ncbi:tetratricopeptide repeat protein [Flavobacterium sp. RHBU_24]|uniref:tetratricopeptide repeat protein n=1 Tax=Flavobacterium sp. RHBU_24 TaxID=3391185 RepID=UPI0039850A20
MKNACIVLLFITALLGNTQVSAQEKCAKAFAVLTERSATPAGYDEALAALTGLRKDCPKYDIGIYSTGDKLLSYKYKTTKTAADKDAIADNLIKLYNEQQSNFPGSGAQVKKALFLNDNKKADDKDTFKTLDEAFTANSAQFTDYRELELYFNLYLKQYEAKAPGITLESFIKTYGDITAQIATAGSNIAKNRGQLQKKIEDGTALEPAEKAYLTNTKTTEEALSAVADNMAKQVSVIFSCEKMEAYYTENFEKNKDNAAWIGGMVHTLKAMRCNKSPLLFKGVSMLYKLNPTYDNTYELGYFTQKQGDAKAATELYLEAAEKQPVPAKKAGIYMTVAQLYRNNDKARAKEYALRAAQTDVKLGSPYLFIAEMYMNAGAECKLSALEKKALVFPALELLKKAEAAEPKYKATVASLEEQYVKSIPTKKEARAEKKSKGDAISYGCWINETVTLPKLK